MLNLKTGKHFTDAPTMTRGGFLKGILASGIAPSLTLGAVSLAGSANATVGGMMRGIGARQAAMFGGGKPTAKDYVQDGLIAMWDGIENAGWGVHDESVNYAVDLTGINTTLSGIQIVENGMKCNKPNITMSDTLKEIFVNGFFSFQFVIPDGTDGKAWSYIVSLRAPSDWTAFSCRINGYQGIGAVIGKEITPSAGEVVRAGTIVSQGSSASIYNRSTLLSSHSGITHPSSISSPLMGIGWLSGYGSWVFDGKIGNVRFYNRVLSDDEIANNYNVDKARFNLQ